MIEREAIFYFMDLGSHKTWQIRLNRGMIPWWIGLQSRRVLDTRLRDYLSFYKMLLAGKHQTVVPRIKGKGIMYDRFWRPLTVAVLNTDPRMGSALGVNAVLRETFLRGSRYSRPLLPRESLGASLVDPGLAWIQAHGGQVVPSTRLQGLELGVGSVLALEVSGQRVELALGDCVVMAVSAGEAENLLPQMQGPVGSSPIVNVHFGYQAGRKWREEIGFIGLVGGIGEWIFFRPETVSVTVSAANDLVEGSPEVIAGRIWQEIGGMLELGDHPLPRYRVIKERRATFLQTPDNFGRRPGTRTQWSNLFLAGDWTDTGLPATLEGAVRSGFKAADAVRGFMAQRN